MARGRLTRGVIVDMVTLGRASLASGRGAVEVRVDAATHTGLVRSANEDSLLAELPIYLVADGMGGHERGDLASRTAVAVFRERLAPDVPTTPDTVMAAIAAANEAVRALSDPSDVGTRVAGTTLAGVALVDAGDHDRLYWMAFNVGDSRVYTWDGRFLEQLSVDHSAVQELIDAGVIDAGEAAAHPDRNVITRALGADSEVDADVWLLPATDARNFLICSDGLSKELDDERIALVLATRESSAAALVAAAVAAGGRDNVTAVTVQWSGPDAGGDPDRTGDRPVRTEWSGEDTTPRLVRGA